jgi:gamma-glutamylcyclotransferase (GGCT)/AIG2-like uncharacterized protein YtfP
MKVFVYGTLKEGFSNHRCLGDSTLVGRGTTVKNYRMFTNGFFPMLTAILPGEGYRIRGEVYDVTESILKRLDLLEGVGSGLYRRESTAVILEDGSRCTAFVYVYARGVAGYSEVPSGNWEDGDND